jgi:hypothetical protein
VNFRDYREKGTVAGQVLGWQGQATHQPIPCLDAMESACASAGPSRETQDRVALIQTATHVPVPANSAVIHSWSGRQKGLPDDTTGMMQGLEPSALRYKRVGPPAPANTCTGYRARLMKSRNFSPDNAASRYAGLNRPERALPKDTAEISMMIRAQETWQGTPREADEAQGAIHDRVAFGGGVVAHGDHDQPGHDSRRKADACRDQARCAEKPAEIHPQTAEDTQRDHCHHRLQAHKSLEWYQQSPATERRGRVQDTLLESRSRWIARHMMRRKSTF